MKRNAIAISVLMLALASCTDAPHSEASKMQQTVTAKNINGELIVTVKTTKDGVTNKETFKGKAAEAKLKELDETEADMESMEAPETPALPEDGTKNKEEKSREVKMTNVNGKKTLTIKETVNGKTTTETYSGDEADKKLKELDD